MRVLTCSVARERTMVLVRARLKAIFIMSTRLASPPLDVSLTPRHIACLRAVAALVWAAALAIAAGDDASPRVSIGLAALVTAYPAIDVVASLTEAALG